MYRMAEQYDRNFKVQRLIGQKMDSNPTPGGQGAASSRSQAQSNKSKR
jgi:hypothetical protein